MKYKVTSQFGRDPERQLAIFESLDDAKLFIEAKLAKDALLKTKVIYRIYKDIDDLIEEFNSESPSAQAQTQSTSGSQGQSSKAGFRPTPFDTTARPAGMPKKWIVNGEEDDKKKG